jgi:uncharacterized protein YhaN
MPKKDEKPEETQEESTQPGTSTQPLPQKLERKRRGGGRLLLRILGWLVALILGVMCGVLGYITLPLLYEQAIAPVQANTADIAGIEERLAEIDAQLTELEAAQTSSAVAQDEALVDFQQQQVDRAAEMEGRLADAEARLNDAERTQADLAGQLDDLFTGLDIQASALELFEARLATLEEEIPGAAEMQEFNRQLLLMRSWQEILKARVRLVQNNAGAAYDELLIAQASLSLAYDASTPEHQAELAPIMARMDDVLAELEDNPFAATEDLEIVWHDLDRLINPDVQLPGVLEGQPEGTEEAPIEATPTPTPTPSP